jgi:predicted nucleic acid-binding protein
MTRRWTYPAIQDPDSLYLSFLTVGEIKKGIAKRRGDARAVPIFNPFDE